MTDSDTSPLWKTPEPLGFWSIPEVDRHGDAWDPSWPVLSISWDDAVAYCEHRTALTGRVHRLPKEEEWEKAARGVDGRLYPWGDEFDAALCKMQWSRQGGSKPEPVGTFPTDQSPYLVRDLAGGIREWCGGDDYLGDPTRRPIRGGSWYTPGDPHLAHSLRLTDPPRRHFRHAGAHLDVRPLGSLALSSHSDSVGSVRL